MEMKFNQAIVQETSGLGQANVSQMLASPLAFEILSTKIYKDKIGSPLRELSSNAVDAHQMVGTPERPIEVKLPSKMDGQFYVRDHGPGLSEDAVMNLYMTYFQSTKSDSNDFTGGFGLGSKSPFCCADQFYVVSAFEGKQTSYVAHRRNDGYPGISKVENSEVPVSEDWPHGLQVGFAVSQDKYDEYVTAAERLYRWYKVKPVIHGVAELNLEERYDFESERFSILYRNTDNNRFNSHRTQSYVIMGTVGYPIETDETAKHLNEQEQALVNSGIVLKVEMGEVSVTVSRESLEYNAQTVRTLKRALAHIVKTTVSAYVEAIGIEPESRSMEAIFNKVSPFRRAFNHSNLIEDFAKKVHKQLSTQAKAAGQTFDLDETQVAEMLRDNFMVMPVWLSTSYDLSVTAFAKTNRSITARKVMSGRIGKNPASLSFRAWPVAVVVDDAPATNSRVKIALERGDLKDALVIRCDDTERRDTLAERVAKYFINLPVIQSSSLPAPPSNRMPRVKLPKGERASAVRVKREELLTFWGHISVVYHEVQGAEIKSRNVTLSQALEKTQYFVQVNGVSDYFVNHEKTREFNRTQFQSVLKRLPALHAEFEERGLTKVIELRGAQVTQLKARDTLELWDKVLFETLAECAGDIEEALDALPCHFDPALHSAYSEKSPQYAAYCNNALLKHLDSWDNFPKDLFTPKKGKTAMFDEFMECLSQDLRQAVEYVFAARGMKRVNGIANWCESTTAKMYNAFNPLLELAVTDEDRTLVTGLRDQLTDGKDFAFYTRIAAVSEFFEGFQTASGFCKFMEKSPERAAQLYNMAWEAGRANQAQLELVVDEAVAA